jgi:hypothetical protein
MTQQSRSLRDPASWRGIDDASRIVLRRRCRTASPKARLIIFMRCLACGGSPLLDLPHVHDANSAKVRSPRRVKGRFFGSSTLPIATRSPLEGPNRS